MAKSFAFWFEKPPESITDTTILDEEHTILASETDGSNVEDKKGAELHFNYWSLNSGKINFLDIGVKFDASLNFESIKIYLPFDNKNLSYCPKLGETICHNHQLIPAVFNAPVDTTKSDQSFSTYLVTFENSKSNPPIKFFTDILVASEQSAGGVKIGPEVEGNSHGTIIKFPKELFKFTQDELCKDLKLSGYFRFRIKLNPNDIGSLSRTYKPKGPQITNQFESSEMVDFRINESRILPLKIRKQIVDSAYINKVHFFLIRDVNSEYRMSHAAYSRCRILEKNIWDKYLDVEGSADNQMLIYHWKSKVDRDAKEHQYIDHFSAFAKFTTKTFPWRDVTIGMLIVLVLGMISSYGTNHLWRYFNSDVQSVEISEILDRGAQDKTTDYSIGSISGSALVNPVSFKYERGE